MLCHDTFYKFYGYFPDAGYITFSVTANRRNVSVEDPLIDFRFPH